MGTAVLCGIGIGALAACDADQEAIVPSGEATAAPTTIFPAIPDRARMLEAVPALATREAAFAVSLAVVPPVVTMDEATLDDMQRRAQALALADERFVSYAWSVPDHRPLRNEIVAVRPPTDLERRSAPDACASAACFVVEMYNYADNMTTVAVVDVDRESVISVDYKLETPAALTAELSKLAWRIALNTPEVAAELGVAPGAEPPSDPEPRVQRTTCEQSRHLCAVPTFTVEDRVLWVVVDLTVGHVVAMRWTGADNLSAAPPSESILLGEHVDDQYCRRSQSLARTGWEMDYMMSRSDGLRLTDVRFDGAPVLRSTKLVDWHVSYNRAEAFGYSDAVGCPFFSSAAVVAMHPPTIEPIVEAGAGVGFALVQDYVHPLWPAACMYNYRQRYEFYDDGRFRIAAASNGGGCGNDGTYRPVIRIVPAGNDLTFSEWDGAAWVDWDKEGWQLQGDDTAYAAEGRQYRLTSGDGTGYYLTPGQGQFGDGGRGDNAYVFVTKYKADEGDDDMTTIGPCCNTDYRQGPEKFIEPEPDAVAGESLAIWYVPQLKNDDTPGAEYCWASSNVEDGLYVTNTWSCYAGPMFVPVGR